MGCGQPSITYPTFAVKALNAIGLWGIQAMSGYLIRVGLDGQITVPDPRAGDNSLSIPPLSPLFGGETRRPLKFTMAGISGSRTGLTSTLNTDLYGTVCPKSTKKMETPGGYYGSVDFSPSSIP